MSRYCLDTSAYSQFKRGVPRFVELIDQAEWIGLPAVVQGELKAGFLLGRQAEANQSELVSFLASPVVKSLDVDQEVSRHYAEIVVDLRRAGTPLPTNDIWIAATAARHGAIVLTQDAHFRAISRVGSTVIPLVRTAHKARPDEEMTPERVADVLLDEEANAAGP